MLWYCIFRLLVLLQQLWEIRISHNVGSCSITPDDLWRFKIISCYISFHISDLMCGQSQTGLTDQFGLILFTWTGPVGPRDPDGLNQSVSETQIDRIKPTSWVLPHLAPSALTVCSIGNKSPPPPPGRRRIRIIISIYNLACRGLRARDVIDVVDGIIGMKKQVIQVRWGIETNK